MATIHDVPINDIIEKVGEELKKVPEIEPPPWSTYVKTGSHKERPPVSDDWWYVRAAAVLRSVYALGPVGVSKLRTKYGAKQSRGYKGEKFRKSGGKHIRVILQQLETAGFVKKEDKTNHKGRVLTPKGRSFVDRVALSILKERK